MIRDILLYLYAKFKGYHASCDRCKDYKQIDTKINFWTFIKNRRRGFVYCVPCWNYIHLKKWTDSKGNKHTLRTEKEVY